jgi:hypothetical protein
MGDSAHQTACHFAEELEGRRTKLYEATHAEGAA